MKRPAPATTTASDADAESATWQNSYVSDHSDDGSASQQQQQCFSNCSIPSCGSMPSNPRRKRPTPSEGERAIIEDLNALSIKEREEVYEDIHGVRGSGVVQETPEMVDRAASNLWERIGRMQRHEKKAYELARMMCPGFVQDRAFVLMFLRADFFDVAKTATRLVNHFEVKLELFGVDRLVKQITWEDLDEGTRAVVLTKAMQHFPGLVDTVGRTVIIGYTAREDYSNQQNHHRATWYFLMGLMRDNEDAQRRGVVAIGYMIGMSEEKLSESMSTNIARETDALPMRYAALHICYNSPKLRPTLSFMQVVASTQTRLRLRAHFGSDVECLYELMAFGVKQDVFPVDSEGNLSTDRYSEALDARRRREAEMEEARRQSSKIEYPRSIDVLFGRGKTFKDFHGNVLMHACIDRYKDHYRRASSREEKTTIVEVVVMTIKDSGARFLKRCKDPMDGWEVVPFVAAREKISYTIRARLK